MRETQSTQIDYSRVDQILWARPAGRSVKDLLDADPIIVDVGQPKEARSSNLDKALCLAGLGYRVFPCRETATVDPETSKERKAKTPYTDRGFKDGTTDAATIRKWWTLVYPQALVGLPTGKESGIVVADLDVKGGKDWRASAKSAGLDLPDTHSVTTRSGGEHRYYRYPADVEKIASESDMFKHLVGSQKTGIDVRGDGGYVIAWDDLTPDILATLTEWPTQLFADAQRRDDEAAGRAPRKEGAPQQRPGSSDATPDELERAREALKFVQADDRDTWVKIGMALKDAFADDGREAWDEWARTSDKYDANDQEAKWRSFNRSGIGLGTLFQVAKENGWRPPEFRVGEGEQAADEGIDAEITRLSALSAQEYEIVRKEEAKRLGRRLPQLDAAVARARSKQASKEDGFERDRNGLLAKNEANMLLAFSKLGVRLAFNELSGKFQIEGLPAFGPSLDDGAIDELFLTIDREFDLKLAERDFVRIVEAEGRRKRFHPVKDYLLRLEWDGTDRIDEWLTTYLGAESNELTRAVGRLTLIAAVRRVRQPGCKFETLMVLEGEQGVGKSRAVRALCSDETWFSDCVTLHNSIKEVMELTAGKWIVEIGELAGMKKAAAESLKSMLSRQCDESRRSYGRYKAEQSRQSIFIGTTNEASYLIDDTGNRRFLPVKVGVIDVEALARDRDQLWAEAAHWEAAGEQIFLPRGLLEMAEAEQREREHPDEWEGTIVAYLSGKLRPRLASALPRVTIMQVAQESALVIEKSRVDSVVQKRIGRCMRKVGWKMTQRSDGNRYWTLVEVEKFPLQEEL